MNGITPIICSFLLVFPSERPLIAQLHPTTGAKPLPFERIKIERDWRLRKSFDYSSCKGIVREEDELLHLWESMVNAYDEEQLFLGKKNKNQPVMPVVDYVRYSVVWYADRCSDASFTTMKEVIEYDDFIQVHIVLHFSDFGSNGLGLWQIPRTAKEVRFVESKKYEERGP